MKKIVVAIDGFSSGGKSTMAKDLARDVGYTYIDSGAMYRAVALYAMRNGWITENDIDIEALKKNIGSLKIDFKTNEQGVSETYLNGENVEKEIRTLEVANAASRVSVLDFVRKELVRQQQQMGLQKGIVMDGRDIGTTVFPQAELKIFVTADPAVRVERRFKELYAKNPSISIEEVKTNLEMRDYTDSNREFSPLRKAADAIELDNSSLTREEQLDIVLKWAREKMKQY